MGEEEDIEPIVEPALSPAELLAKLRAELEESRKVGKHLEVEISRKVRALQGVLCLLWPPFLCDGYPRWLPGQAAPMCSEA